MLIVTDFLHKNTENSIVLARKLNVAQIATGYGYDRAKLRSLF